MKIPMVDLKAQYDSIANEIDKAIKGVIESTQFIMGDEISLFEAEVAGYLGAAQALGVASGSDALLLALMACEAEEGDEVITTPFTFFSTAGAIVRVGAKPVFVDIDPGTYNIDPGLIEEKITEKTKIIMPVHLYGQCADMEPIMELARKYDLRVVEDVAQAFGAKYRGKKAGAIGHVGCLSFFPTKNLGCYGDGGMVVTNDNSVAEKVRVLRAHGSNPKDYHSVVGINSRLDTMQASILRVKLRYIDEWNRKRVENARLYSELFDGARVVAPYEDGNCYHIYHQYVIGVKEREKLIESLKTNGIGCAIYYPMSLHLQECFSSLGYREGDMPFSEKASSELLALPMYPELTLEQQKNVAMVIKEFVGLS